ncbi:MAG: ketoacyl-ACP synthase III [Elusimicrobiales bacterium]
MIITGTGRAFGETRLSNEDIARECGAEPSSPVFEAAEENGFAVRWRADADTCVSTLMARAAKKAIASAGLAPEDIGLLICVTDTPDFVSPPTAARVQSETGAHNAGFFDLNCSCSGFVSALVAADSLMCCDQSLRHVLIAGGNLYSRALAPDDVLSRLMFSDSAGAVVLSSGGEGRGLCGFSICGDGSHWWRWGIFAGGSWKGFSPETLAQGFQHLKTVEPYKSDINLKNWPLVAGKALRKAGWDAKDVELAFLTQSRRKNIETLCRRLGWPDEISHDTAGSYGYCGSGCIPIALDDAREKGRLRAGRKLLILASGVGYGCAAAAFTW